LSAFNFLQGGVIGSAREKVMESVIFSEKIQIERKLFFLDMKENPRGRFLKITEDVGGRRDTIIVPSTGLSQFRDAIVRAIAAGEAAIEQPVEVGGAS